MGLLTRIAGEILRGVAHPLLEKTGEHIGNAVGRKLGKKIDPTYDPDAASKQTQDETTPPNRT